jgi:uncharacterized Zn-finger protein
MTEPVKLKSGEQAICPNKAMPLWSSHPKVYLHPDDHGNATCPYCGTRYHVEGGKKAH